MKILFITLITLLFAGCGENKNTSDWKAPNIYYLRAEGSKSVVLSGNEEFLLNDYIYFSESQSENPNIETIKNEGVSIRLTSNAKCVANGKSFTATNSYKKNYVQLKEIVPIDATLYPKDKASCKIQIQIKNLSGSTKTYILPERSLSSETFHPDLSFKESISESELNTTQILDLKIGERLKLYCDSFSQEITNPGVSSLTFDQFISKSNKMIIDIPIQQYKPNQHCRVSISSGNKKIISNLFLILFNNLLPKYSYTIHKNYRDGARLYIYNLSIKNPHSVPVSVALKKSALTVPLYENTSGGGSKEVGDRPDRTHHYTASIQTSFSGNANIVDKGNIEVIFLLPGHEYNLLTYKDVHCKANSCTYGNMNDSHMPIYNLEYNYRSIEEINSVDSVNILGQMERN